MKNLTGVIHLLSICILSLLLNNCKDKDCHEDGTCAPDYRKMPLGEAKSYLWSLTGSYWIYKNTATGDIDTQTCLGFVCDTIIVKGDYPDTKHITIEYERIWRLIYSTFNKNTWIDETFGYNPNTPRSLKAIMERRVNGFSAVLFLQPFVFNDGGTIGSSVTLCKGVDSTIDIQGKTYNNVAKFEIDLDNIWDNATKYPNTIYYWTKNIGLIKRENKTENFAWELIDYKIIN